MILFSSRRAANLHVAGVECSETGNEGEAGCLVDATQCRVEPAERRHMEVPAGPRAQQEAQRAGAIENYTKALALDPERGDTLYNLGLIYKYRGEWAKSSEFNARAREFQPDDEATLWNLAIAATALRDWATAREVWGLSMAAGVRRRYG